MMKKVSRDNLIRCLHTQAKTKIIDRRNINACKYSAVEAVMTVFSAFYIQQPSLLRHEKNLRRPKFRRNISRLFLEKPVPYAQTIRDILDPIPLDYLHATFNEVWRRMDRSGLLKKLRFDDEIGLLLASDGVWT